MRPQRSAAFYRPRSLSLPGLLWCNFPGMLGRSLWRGLAFGLARLGRRFGDRSLRGFRFRCGLRSRRRCHHHGWRRRNTFPLTLHHFALLARHCRNGTSNRCLRSTPAPGWRRWWRRRRGKRLQEFQSLRVRTQLPVKQQHEHVACNLWIFWQRGSNQQLRHLGQWNSPASTSSESS